MYRTCLLQCLLIKKYFPMIKIYHNQRCSKSRCTLDIIRDRSVEMEVVDYQANPPSSEELIDILRMLDMKTSRPD